MLWHYLIVPKCSAAFIWYISYINTAQYAQSVTGYHIHLVHTQVYSMQLPYLDSVSSPISLLHIVVFNCADCLYSLILCYTGIALTGGKESTGDNSISSDNDISNYTSYSPKNNGSLFRCLSGLGPTSNDNSELGRLYFNGSVIPSGKKCHSNGPVIQPVGAPIGSLVGVINVYLCKNLTIHNEGVYTFTMRNSSMVEESVSVGFYLPGRSEFVNTVIYYIYRFMVYLFRLKIKKQFNRLLLW